MSIRTDPNDPRIAAAVAWNGKKGPQATGEYENHACGSEASFVFARSGTEVQDLRHQIFKLSAQRIRACHHASFTQVSLLGEM